MPPKKRRGANGHGGETRAKAAPQADDSRGRGASPALLLGGAVVVCGAAMLFLGPEQGGGSAKAARQKAVAVNYTRHEVEPARIGLAEWSASSYVEQVDFEAPGAPEAIKARLLGKTQKPLVVVNAMGGMEELSKFGSAQHLNEVMGKWEAMPYQERKDERNRMNVAGGAMTATKFSKSRLFSYWDNNMKWLGKGNTAGSGIGVPNQASWHYWRYKEVAKRAFFKTFEYASAPYLYWYSPVPASAMGGLQAEKLLCRRLASRGLEAACTKEGGYLWANSAGVTAQAHYDRAQTIHVQLSGQKTWTFWAPEDLAKMCYHPFSHPGSRQSAADMGDGIGVACATLQGLHNRTVTLSAGDALLFPPYWSHRVETTTATISYSIGFDGPDVSAYDRVEKAVYEYLLFAAKGELHLRYSAKGGTPGATVPRARRAEASAGLRVLLRGVLRGKLGKAFRVRAFLKVDWTNTYSGLSDAAKMGEDAGAGAGGGWPDTAELCAAEQALSERTLAALRKHARYMLQQYSQIRPAVMNEELRYLVGTVLTLVHGSTPAQNTPLIEFKHTKAWHTALWQCDT